MFLPARRLTELKTWSGPTRSSSSTGGTIMTMIRRLAELRARADFLLFVEAMRLVTMPPRCKQRKRNEHDGRGRRICVANRVSSFDPIPLCWERNFVKQFWIRILCATLLAGCIFPRFVASQPPQAVQPAGPYARIAIMRAVDGHGVEWEAGYVRHL